MIPRTPSSRFVALALVFTALAVIFVVVAVATVADAAACDDGQPPVVEQVIVAPRPVPIGPFTAHVTIKANVTEGAACDSGVDHVVFHAAAANGQGQWTEDMARVGGTDRAGTYMTDLAMPEYTTIGRWLVDIKAFDNAGRAASLHSGADAVFRTKADENVHARPTTTRVRADGTVTITGKVERYDPYNGGWVPTSGQQVHVVFHPATGRYVFHLRALLYPKADGTFKVRLGQHRSGYWSAYVEPTKRLYGAESGQAIVVTR